MKGNSRRRTSFALLSQTNCEMKRVLRNIIKMIDMKHIKRCLGLHVPVRLTSRCNYSYLSFRFSLVLLLKVCIFSEDSAVRSNKVLEDKSMANNYFIKEEGRDGNEFSIRKKSDRWYRFHVNYTINMLSIRYLICER